MTAAVPRASLIVFQSARNVLKQCSGKLVREHPLAALLGLLVNRDNIPLVGSNRTPVGSDQLSGLLNQVYNKSAPFDEEISEISLPLATREFMYVISLTPDAAAGGVPGVGSSEEEVSAYLRRAASSLFSWLNLVPS